ncbi:hypothetical protein RclHR1_07400004 [Rhizophagus clarus]|uniref:Protein kinase domain-containing protein n=1 Tax=Rhizophagus clarus TaxID=94130 RepID=A0A2Z6SKY0_9GLOM|nr:hypothetical protein RclHR1_07400004 [Rhizophagus clarus]
MFDNWINERNIKCFDIKEFFESREIGDGSLGKAFYTNKNLGTRSFVLKSINVNDIIVEELVNDLEMRRKFNAHVNILKFYGVVKCQPETGQYLLVMEYANSGALRQYLKEKFEKLTWDDKYHLATQLVTLISNLHDEEIVHGYLNSNALLVHENTLKLKFFKKVNKKDREFQTDPSMYPYTDPNLFKINVTPLLDKKNDVYSVGILLWEISSGKPPFGDNCSFELVIKIINGYREQIIPNTPVDYSKLYTECWDDDPAKRPSMCDVVKRIIDERQN